MAELSMEQRTELLGVLAKRFEENMRRHPKIYWDAPLARLETSEAKLWSLYLMEQSGGQPDVIGYEADTDSYIFIDCSAESPKERRNLCYDDAALASRKQNKPRASALGTAAQMGVEMLDEAWYKRLQELGQFDLKTSSWVYTPAETRALGGALFGDRRYDRVFIYHNGAESYYSVRGFRAMLRV